MKYTSIFSVAVIIIGLTSAYFKDFLFGFFILFAALFLLINSFFFIFTSDKSQHYKKKLIIIRSALVILVCASALGVYFIEQYYEYIPPAPQPSVVITPSNDPTPSLPDSCLTLKNPVVPDKAALIFLGNSLFIATKFPTNIISYGSSSVLSIDKNSNGDIELFANVWDTGGNLIGRIDGNKFIFASTTISYRIISGTSTLEIYDQYENQILSFDFINSSTIKLLGTFYNDSNLGVFIEENGQYIGKSVSSRTCFRNSPLGVIPDGQ